MRVTGGVLDLNADLGEGMGDDEALLAIVTSASIACGGHAGDPDTMRRTVTAALERGVAIGAHPSYPDREGFGRRALDLPPAALQSAVASQLEALRVVAEECGAAVAFCKPHGALYNTIARDPGVAAAVVRAVASVAPGLPVLGLPGSVFLRLAEESGLRPVAEAFADRGYRADGSLVPRTEPGAVLHDPVAVAARAVRMAVERTVTAVDGTEVDLAAGSLCLHGDTPGAVALARRVRAALEGAGVVLAPFAG